MGINSSAVDSYARFYWFDIVQKIMRKLRREDKCFIVKKDKNYFVLKSLEECTHYKNQCDGAIDKMEKAKIRAEEWVENEKWKNMNIPTESEDEDSKDEEEDVDDVHEDEVVVINKPKEINDYKNKLKTKVIKLWKGEEE
jgi:hypothetical protein